MSFLRGIQFTHETALKMHYDYDDFTSVLGTRIKALRKDRGWTQMQMTRDFGYYLSHWQNIETGRKMSLETLLRVANTFDITLDELLHGIRRRMGVGFGSKGAHLSPPKTTAKKTGAPLKSLESAKALHASAFGTLAL